MKYAYVVSIPHAPLQAAFTSYNLALAFLKDAGARNAEWERDYEPDSTYEWFFKNEYDDVATITKLMLRDPSFIKRAEAKSRENYSESFWNRVMFGLPSSILD